MHGGDSGSTASVVRLLAAEDGLSSLLSEDLLREWVDLLVRLVEAAGAVVIFVGAVLAGVAFVRAALVSRSTREFVRVRLRLGQYLALGLEFQLASDVLRTAIAPSFEELGKLAAVAAIRTVLNYFLAREIKEEQLTLADRPDKRPDKGPDTGPDTGPSAGSATGSTRA